MDFPLIISFYTVKTPYQIQVHDLIASCEKYNLETDIQGIKSQNSWELNCAYKPFFILEQLEKYKRPVLWVDSDGVFVGEPTWQKAFEKDLSVRIENVSNTHPSKVISSTIFVRPEGKDLVYLWVQKCREMLLHPNRQEEFWDQIALREVVLQQKDRVSALPLEYAKIVDHPKDVKEVLCPVIEHYQVSRHFKKIINRSLP